MTDVFIASIIVYRPNCRSLLSLVVDQVRKTAFFVEVLEVTCETFYLLLKTEWTRDALTVDAQICADVEASLTPPRW